MASSNLATIKTKVRRLTRSPTTARLSEEDLEHYINTAIENDVPATLKLFSLRTNLTFYTQPGVDVYQTEEVDTLDPLYNFKNKYTAVHQPMYVAGVPVFYTQDQSVFYGNWPQTNAIQNTGLFGDGTTGPFAGTINTLNQQVSSTASRQYILHNSVMFTAIDTSGEAMVVVDTPENNQSGILTEPNSSTNLGSIDYTTGVFDVTFPNTTALTTTLIPNPIVSEYIGYTPGIPTTVLYYDNKFTLRPVPDKAYVVKLEANIRPTELLESTDEPFLTQAWQWIACLAARKVFEDRMDMDSVQLLTPFLMEQQTQVLSRTMEQYTNQRTTTIYTNNGVNTGWNNFGQWPY